MRKTIQFFLLVVLILIPAKTYSQEHGFIGGLSLTGFNKVDNNASSILNYDSYGDYDRNFHVGYLYRQKISTSYLVDIYALTGIRTSTLRNGSSSSVLIDGVWVPIPRDTVTYPLRFKYVSFGIVGSYKIWKNIHIGIGLEPTVYYSAKYPVDKTSSFIFDVPLVCRLGYAFKYFDISASFKKGNASLVKDINFRSLKTSDFQFSIFVPVNNFLPKK
jgi:hypothetical protein